MCGIAGWVGFLPSGEHVAESMAQALFHRGPDAYGIKKWPEATLVHTRLSIIDTSAAGAQPMSNEDGTVWTTFNGEIYNHRELRHDMEARGHMFKGHSDTEVLPHLYEEFGLDFVNKLRGMFALAIYDTKSHTLILARDRFGIKPLFFAVGKERIAFASEIRALLNVPGIDLRPDRQAIYDFAALFFIPAPETFYKGIRSLQPGKILETRISRNMISCKEWNYHRWTIAPDPGLTLTQAADKADALLNAAVRQQMESDVPLGALLSGGIDSSLVSVAAQRALSHELRTFNVRFPEELYDETWAAESVARHIGSNHTTLDIENGQGTWNHVTELLRHAGQPFADTSLFAVNAVSRLMRRHVTVALSGDGGDEAFGGYSDYWRIARIASLQKLPIHLWRGGAALLDLLAWPGIISPRLPQRARDLTGSDDTSIVQALWCWIREEEHRQLCCDTHLLPVRRLFERHWDHYLPARASRLEQLSAQTTEVNTRLLLPDDFLFKVDTASMKEGLEVRVPMLNEDLFSFGLTLPHSLKVDGRTCKRVLREVAKRRLPQMVASKPKKGFVIPVDKWVDREFKEGLRESLLGKSSHLPDFFRPETYNPLVEAFCDGRQCPDISRIGLYQRAIMLLSVHLALEKTAIQ